MGATPQPQQHVGLFARVAFEAKTQAALSAATTNNLNEVRERGILLLFERRGARACPRIVYSALPAQSLKSEALRGRRFAGRAEVEQREHLLARKSAFRGLERFAKYGVE
jgi:hypothetical protein